MSCGPAPDPACDAADRRVAAPIIERLDALLAAALAELERRAPDSLPSHLVRNVAMLAAARRSLTASQRPVAAAAAPTPAFVDNGPKFPPPMPFDEWNYHVAHGDLNEAVQEYHRVWRATGKVPVWTPPGPAP